MSSTGPAWVREQFLEQCLDRQVYRLRDNGAAGRLLSELAGRGGWMIEARVPVEQVSVLAALTGQGFRVIDTNVQLDCPSASLRRPSVESLQCSIRAAQPADREAVCELAGQNLTTSRFHLDPQLSAQAAAAVKRAWVENFFIGKRGNRMLLVDTAEGPAGFLLVLEQGDVGVIDLIALAPTARGSSATFALVAAWITQAPQLRRIVVGTQIANVRSMRAYGKLGFRIASATHVLHRHPD